MTFEKTKLSACPTPWTRSDPLSNEANWALVAGGLFFFIVYLLYLLRPQKEEENPLKGRKEGVMEAWMNGVGELMDIVFKKC